MGNRMGCNEAGVRCAADCARFAARNGDCINEFEEGGYDTDPAGAIFEETMEDLSHHDKHLLFFCGSQNLAAVKWLSVMRGSDNVVGVSDSNSTSCLHHACRSGSLPIVRYLLESRCDPNGRDQSGWSPLHIATFMGGARRDVVKTLLAFSANPRAKTVAGKTPLDFCNDPATRQLFSASSHPSKSKITHSGSGGGFFELVRPTPESTHTSSHYAAPGYSQEVMSPEPHRNRLPSPSPGLDDIQIEPFFVPQSAEVNYLSPRHEQVLSVVGLDFFNASPGHGLSFLVSSGCVGDSPQPLLNHLGVGQTPTASHGVADRGVFGQFLGETYSLSQILRLESMNALPFEHSGVVEALKLVGGIMSWPADFEKLDRLTFCCALMWWRKHEDGESRSPSPVGRFARDCDGYGLKQHIHRKQNLHQLMFATLILHMNLNNLVGRISSPSALPMTLPEWVRFCRGIVTLPESFLHQIYLDARTYSPNLVICKPKPAAGPAVAFPNHICVCGWASVQGSMLPHAPASTWQRPPTFDILSEKSSTIIGSSRQQSQTERGPLEYAAALSPFPTSVVPTSRATSMSSRKGGDRDVWLAVLGGCLFFFHADAQAQANHAPWAYLYLPDHECNVAFGASSSSAKSIAKLPVAPSSSCRILISPRNNPTTAPDEQNPEPQNEQGEVKVVVLRNDAKWTVVSVPRLDLTLRHGSVGISKEWERVLVANSQQQKECHY